MRLAPYVKFRDEQFGGVLFETRSDKVYTLTPTAAAVVHEIKAGRNAYDIAPRLAMRYSAPPGVLDREVDDFVAELRDKGLVED